MSENKHLENEVNELSEEKKEVILENFERFKTYLGDKVNKAEKLGLNEEALAQSAEKIADYLAKHEEPRNREEYLLRELWKVGNEEQQHMLAHMLVRMVQDER